LLPQAWGNPKFGGRKAPADKGYIKIYSTDKAFAALKDDGSITSWGNLDASNSDDVVWIYTGLCGRFSKR
jgi:hypothetical protein